MWTRARLAGMDGMYKILSSTRYGAGSTAWPGPCHALPSPAFSCGFQEGKVLLLHSTPHTSPVTAASSQLSTRRQAHVLSVCQHFHGSKDQPCRPPLFLPCVYMWLQPPSIEAPQRQHALRKGWPGPPGDSAHLIVPTFAWPSPGHAIFRHLQTSTSMLPSLQQQTVVALRSSICTWQPWDPRAPRSSTSRATWRCWHLY